MQRRIILQAMLVTTLPVSALVGAAAGPVVDVYKTAGCGCCEVWINHLKANGFGIKAQNVSDTGTYRAKLGLPNDFGSCHTGFVQGYAVEGHVPAADIKRLLAEKPKAKGLAVPSMLLGSPWMEGPRKDPYDVFLIKVDGSTSVYQHYSGRTPKGTTI